MIENTSIHNITYERLYHYFIKPDALVNILSVKKNNTIYKGKAFLIEDKVWEKIKELFVFGIVYDDGYLNIMLQDSSIKG